MILVFRFIWALVLVTWFILFFKDILQELESRKSKNKT